MALEACRTRMTTLRIKDVGARHKADIEAIPFYFSPLANPFFCSKFSDDQLDLRKIISQFPLTDKV